MSLTDDWITNCDINGIPLRDEKKKGKEKKKVKNWYMQKDMGEFSKALC